MRDINHDSIIGETRRWVERAVIGLGLCPFADVVYRQRRVRFRVSEESTASGVLAHLSEELLHLRAAPASECETTLLIHPWALNDFLEFNDFLEVCDALVEDLELDGEIQVASFHPRYQFAGTAPDDIENHTNRSPHPTLHLLRESSVELALEAVPEPALIYERNIRRLRELGSRGWAALWTDAPSIEATGVEAPGAISRCAESPIRPADGSDLSRDPSASE